MDQTPNKEIEVDGQTYLIGRLDVFKQFHVARRIAPILASLGASLAGGGADAGADPQDGLVRMLAAASQVIAKMPEEDVNYVLNACLSAAKRKSDDKWARVMTGGSNLMFADMTLDAMMRVTVETVRENLGRFFPMWNEGTQ